MHADKPHILIVDDDERLRDLIARYTWGQGFVPLTAKCAQDARDLLDCFEFDAMVLDIMMPNESGLEFAKNLEGKDNVPILFLTALGEAQDRINGLMAGADDYLTKPFEPQELTLRLKTIIKRTAKLSDNKIGKWTLDVDVLKGSPDIQLTSAQGVILKVLLESKGKPVSRDALAKSCGLSGERRAVDVQITRLRRKIEVDTKRPALIKTVRGKGYMLSY